VKKQIFNNAEVTKLLERYSRHPHSMKLRARLMIAIIPLIDAAISRKRLFHLRDELRQECALKLLKNMHKFKKGRGSAFAFCWSAICNSIISQGKRLSKPSLSLEEEEIAKEAEVAAPLVFQSPEYQYLQKIISIAIDKALFSPELRSFTTDKKHRALSAIRDSVLNGELFSKREHVLKKLRRLRVPRADSQFLIDYVIVSLRAQLYSKKELLYELAARKTSKGLSEVIDQ